jgi:hypothetical protein
VIPGLDSPIFVAVLSHELVHQGDRIRRAVFRQGFVVCTVIDCRDEPGCIDAGPSSLQEARLREDEHSLLRLLVHTAKGSSRLRCDGQMEAVESTEVQKTAMIQTWRVKSNAGSNDQG